MGDITWKLNSYDLDEALGAFLTDTTVWRPNVTVRRSPITIPSVHGTTSPAQVVFDEPQVTISPKWNCASQADLEEKTNHARALFAQPTLLLGRVSGGLETSAKANLVSISEADFLVGQTASCVILLAIPGVFFRSTLTTGDDLDFSTDLASVEIGGLSGSTGPVPDATIRITGPCTNPYVTDPLSGTGISWAGTLTAGQYLFLRARPLTGRVSTDPDSWVAGGTDVSAQVSFPAAGRLQLWPVVQTATSRKVLLSATGTGKTAATKLAVSGQGSYL